MKSCLVCHRCKSCGCICQTCDTCGLTDGGHGCRDCGHCRKKCGCRARSSFEPRVRSQISLLTPNYPITKDNTQFVLKGSRIVNKLVRPVGIEIEIAEWNGLKEWRPNGWMYEKHGDNSVQPSGLEMVLPPMAGDDLITKMNEVGQELIRHRCTVNNSCGLHVHVSGTDISWWEVPKLLMLWKGIERDVFQYLVRPSRADSKFCKPLELKPNAWRLVTNKTRDIRLFKMALFNNMYGEREETEDERLKGQQLETLKGNKYPPCRYYALNLHAWLRQGTFEFRLHEGSVDAIEIIKWAMFCGWIVECLSTISFEQAKEIYQARNTHGKPLRLFQDLTSPSFFSIKQKFILPDEVRNYINERIS